MMDERDTPYHRQIERWDMLRDEMAADVSDMRFPVRCTRCSKVYDLGKVKVTGRYTDCTVWRCPGCDCTVDDRPVGWGDHHYVELDQNGREVRR